MFVSQSGSAGRAHGALLPVADANTGQDGRWSKRQQCRIAAEITHLTLPTAVACVVRDTSSAGARVELAGARGAFSAGSERIPDRITLIMPMDRIAVECQVTWRKGQQLGLRYLSPARMIPKRAAPQFASPAKARDTGVLGKLFRK